MMRLLMRLTVTLVMAAIMAVTASVALAEPKPSVEVGILCPNATQRIDGAEKVLDDQAGRLKPTQGVAQARDNMIFKMGQTLCD